MRCMMRRMLRRSVTWTVLLLGATANAGPLGKWSRAELDAWLDGLQGQPISNAVRIERVSNRMRGTRYVLDPLGEGERGEMDRDPIVDLERVDCLTFVETVMALAKSSSLENATARLQRIRYKGGAIGWATRNHFTAAHWWPANVEAGFLRDRTAEIGGASTRRIDKRYDERAWTGKWKKWLRLGSRLPQRAEIAYVPIEEAESLDGRLPDALVVAQVMADAPHRPTLVSHVVLAVRTEKGVVVRHAVAPPGRVIEMPWGRYVRWVRRLKKVKIIGFAFGEPL